MERLYTLREFAEYFGVTDRTVSNWVQKGVIPVVQLVPNGKVWVRESDIEELVSTGGAK